MITKEHLQPGLRPCPRCNPGGVDCWPSPWDCHMCRDEMAIVVPGAWQRFACTGKGDTPACGETDGFDLAYDSGAAFSRPPVPRCTADEALEADHG